MKYSRTCESCLRFHKVFCYCSCNASKDINFIWKKCQFLKFHEVIVIWSSTTQYMFHLHWENKVSSWQVLAHNSFSAIMQGAFPFFLESLLCLGVFFLDFFFFNLVIRTYLWLCNTAFERELHSWEIPT